MFDIQNTGSFRTKSNSGCIIYGFVFFEQTVTFNNFFIDNILVSRKFVEFDNSGVKNVAVIFEFLDEQHNEDLIVFLLDSFVNAYVDGITINDFDNIIKVLRSFTNNKKNDYIGLFGECVFIYYLLLNERVNEIRWWHTSQFDNYDFTSGTTIYEVKSTTNVVRKHFLKYKQHQILLDDYRLNKYYISLILIKSEPDTDLKTLVSYIRDSLSGDDLNYFNKIINLYSRELLEFDNMFNLKESVASVREVPVDKVGSLFVDNDNIDFDSFDIPIKFDGISI